MRYLDPNITQNVRFVPKAYPLRQYVCMEVIIFQVDKQKPIKNRKNEVNVSFKYKSTYFEKLKLIRIIKQNIFHSDFLKFLTQNKDVFKLRFLPVVNLTRCTISDPKSQKAFTNSVK